MVQVYTAKPAEPVTLDLQYPTRFKYMTLPLYLPDFFAALMAEEKIGLKKAFEGDFSDVGKFTILTEKYLEDDRVLLREMVPKFMISLEMEKTKELILDAQKEKIKRNLDYLHQKLDIYPGQFYEIQIRHDENRLSNLSISSLKEEAHSIFNEVICNVLQENEESGNRTNENYLYVFYLTILYEKFQSDAVLGRKYRIAPKAESKLYKYYKSLDVDLKEVDRQFAKYDLLSISGTEQIISGLPNRIFDNKRNSQFLIDIPEILLAMFAALLDSKAIRNISFLVECEVVFQTSDKYFFLLENERTKSPVFLADFLNDARDGQVMRDVIKKPDTPNTFPPHVLAGRFYDKHNDSAWYFIDNRNIYFEEISSEPEVLNDCVVTQLIHAEYFIRNEKILLSHIDHEYIFYSYDEFDRRVSDFSQKGSGRKRIKTFKIDDSEIPLVEEGDVLVLNTLLEYLFKKPYLFNGFLREITREDQ